MYCSLLRRNIYIYNSEWYGGEWGDFYPRSMLGPRNKWKISGPRPCIVKVQLNKFQRAAPFVKIYRQKYASVERVPFKLLSSWQNYFTWIQLCFKHCLNHFWLGVKYVSKSCIFERGYFLNIYIYYLLKCSSIRLDCYSLFKKNSGLLLSSVHDSERSWEKRWFL